MFQHFRPSTIRRWRCAAELRRRTALWRAGVDIGRKVYGRCPVDLRMGHANVMWQGDANSVVLRIFAHCQAPPFILNLTGPETLAVRWVARKFGERFGVEPVLEGEESPTALLNNAALCQKLFGYPSVSVEQMIEWIAAWIETGGREPEQAHPLRSPRREVLAGPRRNRTARGRFQTAWRNQLRAGCVIPAHPVCANGGRQARRAAPARPHTLLPGCRSHRRSRGVRRRRLLPPGTGTGCRRVAGG